jgi:membrane protein YqaA with SNARE-associated domain
MLSLQDPVRLDPRPRAPVPDLARSRCVPSYFSWFLSPLGLLVLATLDSTVVFFLPFANDTVVIYLAASDPDRFWLYAILAVTGGLAGGLTTYWAGMRIGEDGIERWVPRRRMEAVRKKAQAKGGAIALGLAALVPPPFPFTPFMLASGALRVNIWSFFAWASVMRLVRFGVEALLARRYGKQLVSWMNSAVFKDVVWGFIILALAGSAWSVYTLVKKTRSQGRDSRSARPA